MQTLTFIVLVFANQGLLYVLRERNHFWHSRPAGVLLGTSLADIAVVALLAAGGIVITQLPIAAIAMLVVAMCVFVLGMNPSTVVRTGGPSRACAQTASNGKGERYGTQTGDHGQPPAQKQ
jgi:hypothetical protein